MHWPSLFQVVWLFIGLSAIVKTVLKPPLNSTTSGGSGHDDVMAFNLSTVTEATLALSNRMAVGVMGRLLFGK